MKNVSRDLPRVVHSSMAIVGSFALFDLRYKAEG